ncbi:MAG: hypothetical protein DRO52_02820 [Candidatus Hecatellales archaeon]|nr:MAG: hypothetical protein DRO52_02820 [Candidatus Hecatellales archaeon]
MASKMVKVEALLRLAEDFLSEAEEALERASNMDDDYLSVEVAAKLLAALNQAADALIYWKLEACPDSSVERLRMLEGLTADRGYEPLQQALQEIVFSEGLTGMDVVRREAERVREYLSKVRSLVSP